MTWRLYVGKSRWFCDLLIAAEHVNGITFVHSASTAKWIAGSRIVENERLSRRKIVLTGVELGLDLLAVLARGLRHQLECQEVEDHEQHHERQVGVIIQRIRDVRVRDADDQVAQPVDADAERRAAGADRVREQVGGNDPHERAERGAECDDIQSREDDRQRRHVHQEGDSHAHGHDAHAGNAPQNHLAVAEADGQGASGESREDVDEINDKRSDARIRNASVSEDAAGVRPVACGNAARTATRSLRVRC
ncbi:hypothetical protein ON010_g18900 [Phytophthora cinnamomi]|nr:hypothetical protein ON010_g18900 [Phytophthora cinnamomi]